MNQKIRFFAIFAPKYVRIEKIEITMATRFLATKEAPVKEGIKQALASEENDERNTTIVLSKLSNATRVFKNKVSDQIRELEFDEIENQKRGGLDFSIVAPLASGVRTKKTFQETGDADDAMWSCGQSVGLIDDIPTCKELVNRIVLDAELQLANAHGQVMMGAARL